MASPLEITGTKRVPAWRAQLSAFWRWWSGELVRLLPERVAALGGAGKVPIVSLDGAAVVLLEPRSAVGPDSQVELAALDEAARRDAVRALLERAGETRSRARLCLERGEALVRRVRMPAATEENLRQVIAFEMDRLTPFRAEDVYFDCRVVEREAGAGMILIQLAVARREGVDAKVQRLRELGLNVQGVTVRDELGHPGAELELLPSDSRSERASPRERYIVPGSIAVVVLLFVAALLLPVWHKRNAVITGFPLLGKARTDAEATDTIARDLEKQVADYNFLLAKKHATYPALALLEEVTRLLPDNTWVQQIDIRNVGKTREIQVNGETPSSSKLIEIFESSKLLQNAATRGTVTRGSQPNMERFQIVVEPRPRPQPESISLLEAPAVAPPSAPQPAPVPAPAPPQPAQPPTAQVTPVPPPATKPAPAPPRQGAGK
jgi:general secretion pathway protein L